MLVVRGLLTHAQLLYLMPVIAYQDIVAWFVLVWMFHGPTLLACRQWSRYITLAYGSLFCLLLALATAGFYILYLTIQRPFTYQMLRLSQMGLGIRASVFSELKRSWIIIPGFLFAVFAVAKYTWNLNPRYLARMRSAVYSPLAVLSVVILIFTGHAWVSRNVDIPVVLANPEWAFFYSLFAVRSEPKFTEAIPAYEDDVPLSNERAEAAATSYPFAMPPSAVAARGFNVLIIVMESVGTHQLQLYGSSYADTPELMRLSSQAIVFNRAYAAEPNTSAAMAALFCSLYPKPYWVPLIRYNARIPVVGLADVLRHHGYRTAFIHFGQLEYDDEGEFLDKHGFGYIFAKGRDYDTPHDSELPEKVVDWINSARSKPFFLTVWTQDTHHPYVAPVSYDFRTSDDALKRYLNSVLETDAIIGRIEARLHELKLADNTLLVITGDHGEAFGEHGNRVHGFSVYDEEVHVPLMIVNPALVEHGMRIDRIARQIDIAPTLLGILGYPAPPQWQGTNLFSQSRPNRAYLFSAADSLTLGLVDGDLTYMYDMFDGHEALYDLAHDPGEHQNLVADHSWRAVGSRERLRVEAWYKFQRRYLARLASESDATPH